VITHTTPHAAALSTDGQRLFIASHDHTLRCVDIATGQQRWERRLPGHATLLAVHPALPIVAAAYQQRVGLFDATTGAPLLLVGPGSPMGALSFPDADTIIAAPGPDLPRESWRAPLLAWRWPATGGAATTTSDAPPPQAQLALASGALIRSVARPIGKKTELALEHVRPDGATTTLATHPKKDPAVRMAVHEALGLLVAASEERELRVYDLATDALLHTLTGLKRAPEQVAITPDGARVIAVENKTIMSWPLGAGSAQGQVWSQTTKLGQRALAITPDSAQLLTADSDAGKNVALPCELHRWDAQTGAPLSSRPLPWTRAVGAIAFSPAGALLATGPDTNLYVIDLTT
jgi:WD40 repeat protein